MGTPPVILTFVFFDEDGRGDDVLEGPREELAEEDFGVLSVSDISVPDAEGGTLGVGAWTTSGFEEREKAFCEGPVGRLVM